MTRPDSPTRQEPLEFDRVIDLFHDAFREREQTLLRGGFPEPIYIPAEGDAPAEIRFTHDYVRSALHEVAHWCVAGRTRRQETDYGYWYRPDGRSDSEQIEFFRVESRPQAIEWLFSILAGARFRLSLDNIGSEVDTRPFEVDVRRQFRSIAESPPPRARTFAESLAGGAVDIPEIVERHIEDPLW